MKKRCEELAGTGSALATATPLDETEKGGGCAIQHAEPDALNGKNSATNAPVLHKDA